jgi:hypothetical protein
MKFEGKCHYCGGDVIITESKCSKCGVIIRGEFEGCELCRLSGEAKEFIRVFIECEGNIRNVEKVLGISYPTVKSRLTQVKDEFKALSPEPTYYSNYSKKTERKSILKNIEKGNISVEEALRQLREEQ